MTSNNVYEIHRYQHDNFEYVVARTNKYTEEQVKKDIEKMNEMLNEEAKSQGRQRTKKIQRGREVGGEEQQSFLILG